MEERVKGSAGHKFSDDREMRELQTCPDKLHDPRMIHGAEGLGGCFKIGFQQDNCHLYI
jgi:hypothetical protein